ncbi:MAG TPA: response regulator, partial [Vicinamibacterales bacterium]
MNPVALLVVEDDADLSDLIALNARLRGSDPEVAATVDAATRLIASRTVDVALVDLTLADDSGLEAIRAIKAQSPDTEVIVICAAPSLASAIASYELQAFAFVPKPFDIDQLFATVDRAVEHRRMTLSNRRLLWEQRMLNEVGDELRHLVAPERLVERVLNRLMRGMQVDSCAARMTNPETCEDAVRFERLPAPDAASTRLRSEISVPMYVGQELIGTLSLGSVEEDRFSPDDRRLVGIIATQVAIAFHNARLHAWVRRGKQDWEATFDAIGDPIAVFDRSGRLVRGNAALAACMHRSVTSLRGLTCDEIGLCNGTFPDCSVGQARDTACVHEEVTRGDGQIFSVTTCPILDLAEGPAIVQIGKNVTREIQNARRVRQMSDELAAANARLVATVDRLKATQAQLLQAEKLSAIGRLVAGVAHELNNP